MTLVVLLAAYVFALTEQTLIAVIAAAGLVGAAAVTAFGVRISRAVGTPNGNGNLVEMMEALLTGQTGQDVRLAKLETRVGNVETLAKDAASKAALVARTLEEAQARADAIDHAPPGAAADAAAQSEHE